MKTFATKIAAKNAKDREDKNLFLGVLYWRALVAFLRKQE
jgi:hypothetical protein